MLRRVKTLYTAAKNASSFLQTSSHLRPSASNAINMCRCQKHPFGTCTIVFMFFCQTELLLVLKEFVKLSLLLSDDLIDAGILKSLDVLRKVLLGIDSTP